MIWITFSVVFAIALADQSNVYSDEYHQNVRYDGNIQVISSPPSHVTDEDSQEADDVVHRTNRGRGRGSSTYTYQLEDDDGSYDGTWVDTIPGKAGKDFPSYSEIPKTGFSCKGRKVSGYFADVETDCQVFHICMADGHKISFLCPNGSIFNEKVSVCDWWYDVDCETSTEIQDYSNDVQKNQFFHSDEFAFQNFIIENEPYDLNLASSGGNVNPSQEKNQNDYNKKTSNEEKYSEKQTKNTKRGQRNDSENKFNGHNDHQESDQQKKNVNSIKNGTLEFKNKDGVTEENDSQPRPRDGFVNIRKILD